MHTTAEFTLTRDDLKRFQRMTWRRLGGFGAAMGAPLAAKVVLWLLIASAMFLCFRATDRHPSEAPALYLMAGLAAAAIILASMLPHIGSVRARKQIAADRGAFLRPHSLQFTKDTLAVIWSTGRMEQQWSDVIARDSDAANHYLYVDGCSAIIVPRHVVAPFQGDFERYLASIPPA